jgi:glycosyltransferase involved in cell wall biosynthesis
LIVDDGSKDTTEKVVNDFVMTNSRIKYLKNESNLGIQKTLNKGLFEAKGEYIARIDDDDTWCDIDKLSKQVDLLNTNPKCVLVGTGVIIVDTNHKELLRYLVPESDSEIKHKILGKNCFIHSSVLFRKDIAIKLSGYDESTNTRHIEDYDLWLRLGQEGELANLPIYSVKFMLHNASISSQNKVEQYKKILSLIKRFSNKYPNYLLAYLRAWARIIIYGFLVRFPFKISFGWMLKLYKKYW